MRPSQQSERFLPAAAVIERTSLSLSTIYAKMDCGEFPKPVKISRNRVAWPESVVSAWIASKIAKTA